jgi:hypothetical protein
MTNAREEAERRAIAMAALLAQAERALAAASEFITNGVALGFIRMPDADVPDPAHDTPRKVQAALAAIRAHDPPALPQAPVVNDAASERAVFPTPTVLSPRYRSNRWPNFTGYGVRMRNEGAP